MTKKLTAKQQRFIEEYLVSFNATDAAIKAGYSEKTAYSIGNENLSKPEIKAEIERLQGETSKSIQVTKESLINDLLRIKDLCITNPRAVHNSTKAIEVLNKMLGFNEPDKQEVKIDGNVTLKDFLEFEDTDE